MATPLFITDKPIKIRSNKGGRIAKEIDDA